jgi:hypothetical protein
MEGAQWVLPPEVSGIRDLGDAEEGFHLFAIDTARGTVDARLYEAPGTRAGIALVGGVGGGFDSPARGLYPRLAAALRMEGITALRVRFREPADLREAVHDVLAGIALLEHRGVRRIGLVGHSFGGAVVIVAGASSPYVATVVTLATQTFGADAVAHLPPRSLLLIHGAQDDVLPPACSEVVYRAAKGTKEILVLPGAGHGLEAVADEVFDRVLAWMLEALVAVPEPA